ncbi:hypothetical protein BFW01_g1214 [Lasiodiplodia theobromae]|uniref:Major facilitator superfamily (MFS) profile domain-containing protein n=1 Tax=Lasiodiplodia theobromae TaxID=45133 RepID=A0A8H7MC74_9PEZI|nr:hypothetical protein BFW01_g1214 [Lasiodiplodia theobromae]
MSGILDQRKRWMVASNLEKRSLLIAVNCIAGLSIFFFGYDQGMMGGVNESPHYVHLMGFGHVDATGKPIVTKTLLQGGIDADWMICSRLVNGVGTGILNAIVPTWASELADYSSRGAFIAMEFTLNIFGVVVAYWLAFGVSFIDEGRAPFRWRFPIGFQLVPLIFLILGCWVFPESPRWLCRVGRGEEALYILQRLRGTTGAEAGKAEAELAEIKDIVDLESKEAKRNSYFHMFFGIGSGRLHTGRRVQLVIWLQILQCWSGIAGITMYGPTLFALAGFNPTKAQWISGLNNIFYMSATLICVVTIDHIGRRWTLYWGSAAQAVAMFLVGGLARGGLNASAGGDPDTASKWGAAAAAMIYLYTFVFGATWLTVPWVYPAECFPLQVRAKGNAWGVVGWSVGNGSLTLAMPYIIGSIGEKAMYVFGACNVVTIPIVWAFYPESNQRTLEEMDLLFAADTPWVWDAEKKFAELKAEAMARNDGRVVAEGKDQGNMDTIEYHETV